MRTEPTVSFVSGALSCAKALGFLGATSFYDWLRAGLVPKLVELSPKTKVLPLHEISAVNALRLAGVAGDDLRQVVAEIVESREQGLKAPAIVAEIVERVLTQRCSLQKGRTRVTPSDADDRLQRLRQKLKDQAAPQEQAP